MDGVIEEEGQKGGGGRRRKAEEGGGGVRLKRVEGAREEADDGVV